MTALNLVAVLANVLLLIVVVNTIFAQTHWDDLKYIGLVATTVGAPILSIVALVRPAFQSPTLE